MKFVYFGSSEFSQGILNGLFLKGFVPQLIVTKCDKPKGRDLKVCATRVSEFAQSKNIPLIKPESLKDTLVEDRLCKEDHDLFIIADYGKIIPQRMLSIPKIFTICVHPSLLPRYRGASPIEHALLNGDAKTAVTIFKVNEKVDSGEIILQKKLSVDYEDDYISLSRKLIECGIESLIKAIIKIKSNAYTLTAQDEASVSFAHKLKKEDAKIAWQNSAKDIRNLIRAALRWPIAYTYYKDLRLQILSADVIDESSAKGPGVIVEINKNGIHVACGKGILNIKALKPEGKGQMSAWSFACGHRIKAGDKFK